MLLAQLPVERCNSQQSGFGSLQVEFFSTAWVASLTATIFFAFTMFMQLALNQHLLVPEEAKFVCMKMGIQKFDKLFSIPPPPPTPLPLNVVKRSSSVKLLRLTSRKSSLYHCRPLVFICCWNQVNIGSWTTNWG